TIRRDPTIISFTAIIFKRFSVCATGPDQSLSSKHNCDIELMSFEKRMVKTYKPEQGSADREIKFQTPLFMMLSNKAL
ncbi:MAG: hypothetical protein KAG53_11830, partial [Endozoicomonadaceae bacterium]|nr:hypothetical protein [Endozoicomonadaceae bacterium]